MTYYHIVKQSNTAYAISGVDADYPLRALIPGFNGIRIVQTLALCRPSFFLFFICYPVSYLSFFEIRLLVTLSVSSNLF
jgi:hypothetical protein